LVLTNKTPLSKDTLGQLPKLRYIGVLATGYNCVDVTAAKELDITVTNVPTYGTASVAQFTFALLLELCHHVQHHSDAVHSGEWSKSKDWCFWLEPLMELAGKTMGVVGFGRIGRQVAKIADAMGMRVIAADNYQSEPPALGDFSWRPLEDLLTEADVISLHCPFTPETEGLIDAVRLKLVRPTAFLLNTSRGPLVVDCDLAEALNSGRLAGAALDVLSVEPPLDTNPLLSARNCLITPHIAWATREARAHLLKIAITNVKSFLDGKPTNRVA
jgi:glycerate dehydrogenase